MSTAPKLTEYNPYLAARQEWQERYGTFIDQARNWRTVAVVCAITALIATSVALYTSMRNPFKPFPVLVDELGRTVGGGPVRPLTDEQFERVKRGSLAQFVMDSRTVTTDGFAQKSHIERLYARVSGGSAAQNLLNEYYRQTSPFDRAKREIVTVQVNSVLPSSERTYEVQWTETVRDPLGELLSRDKWRGMFTIAISPPKTDSQALANPVGLYVTNINWTKVQEEEQK